MKALLCRANGPVESLELAEVDAPAPAAGEVLVEVAAAAVNFPDVLMVEGKYQYKPPLPFAPGCELAGRVARLGEGVAGLAPGDRVAAFVAHGAFAEAAVAKAEDVVPLPPGVELESAAAFLFTYGTSYHALADRARLAPGETLLVLGAAGGVGLAAVELGRKLGARVIAAASTADKLEACTAKGAEATIDYSREDLRERVKALTGGRGVDVVYDPVGGALTEPALRSLAWGGRLLVVGFAAGDIPRIPLNLPLLKGASIVGVFWGGLMRADPVRHRENTRVLFEWLAAGEVAPLVSARYPLARAAEAIAAVRDRRARGKVLVVP